MTEEPPVSDDVALLWGLRPAARRGRRPALTAEDITRAAVRIADAEGLAALSMARVAAELGNATMALYRHVAGKEQLLLLMSDAALEEPPERMPGEGWREQLTAWAHAVLAMIRKHPWYRQIPLNGPPIGPRNLQWFDRALAALDGTGLPAGDKVVVVTGLLPLVHGQARLSIDLAAGYRDDPEAFGSRYAAGMRSMVDAERFPALRQVIDAGVFGPGGPGADGQGADGVAPSPEGYDDFGAEFAFALGCYFDGVAAFIERRTAG